MAFVIEYKSRKSRFNPSPSFERVDAATLRMWRARDTFPTREEAVEATKRFPLGGDGGELRIVETRDRDYDSRVRTYRVVYLVRAHREWRPGRLSLKAATREVAALKRRGLTAWVTDDDGRFVPIPGTRREPAWIE